MFIIYLVNNPVGDLVRNAPAFDRRTAGGGVRFWHPGSIIPSAVHGIGYLGIARVPEVKRQDPRGALHAPHFPLALAGLY